MSTFQAPESVPERSYLGIGGCVLFAIASASLCAVFVANWHPEYKMSGLEIIVLGPFAVLLYLAGMAMGVAGMCRQRENPLSMTAFVLNTIPFACVVLLQVLGALLQMLAALLK